MSGSIYSLLGVNTRLLCRLVDRVTVKGICTVCVYSMSCPPLCLNVLAASLTYLFLVNSASLSLSPHSLLRTS